MLAETRPYLGSPSVPRALEIDNYVRGFGFRVKYWVPYIRHMGNPHTSSVLRLHHGNLFIYKGHILNKNQKNMLILMR